MYEVINVPLSEKEESLEYGCRCRVKGQCIFGRFEGYTSSSKTHVFFWDEELCRQVIYKKDKIERSYEKLW